MPYSTVPRRFLYSHLSATRIGQLVNKSGRAWEVAHCDLLLKPPQTPMQRKIRHFADLFVAQDSDPTQGQNTRDSRLPPSHAGEILTADGFLEKLKVKNVKKMAKKGKLQRQETRLPSG